MTVIGVSLFSMLQPDTKPYLIVANLILLGAGFSLFSSPNMNAIMGAIDPRHYGTASGVVATMRLLGQMTGMAMATLVFALIIGPREIVPALYPHFLTSVRICFIISACLCLPGIFFSVYRGRLRHVP